ncbi:MAG: hypothetical protein MJ202_06540 [Lentisphaeria bacterium]|nr:hypothetical protein [Lentisphaeria bacterium]
MNRSMSGFFYIYIFFFMLSSVLFADSKMPDVVFQANVDKILCSPVMELEGYVFLSGRVKPASDSLQSKLIAQSMARSKAESNGWLLLAKKVSYEKTILEGRTVLQDVFFNAWRALGQKENYTLRNSVLVFSKMKDGIFCCVIAVKPEDIIFQDTEAITFNKMRSEILSDTAKRNELIVYEIMEEAEIDTHIAEIAAGLEKKVNCNFARMFLNLEPKTPLEKGIEFARKKLSSLGENAKLDDLLQLTSNLPYDRELCQRLASAFRKREMLRWASLMEYLVNDYGKLQKEWEKSKKELQGDQNFSTKDVDLEKKAIPMGKTNLSSGCDSAKNSAENSDNLASKGCCPESFPYVQLRKTSTLDMSNNRQEYVKKILNFVPELKQSTTQSPTSLEEKTKDQSIDLKKQ